jgi:hypothetical protein
MKDQSTREHDIINDKFATKYFALDLFQQTINQEQTIQVYPYIIKVMGKKEKACLLYVNRKLTWPIQIRVSSSTAITYTAATSITAQECTCFTA